jgi:hypothetical protein
MRFVETRRSVVDSDFTDQLGDATIVDLPGVTPGPNWERFRAKARDCHHLALQRLRRNLQLTPDDLTVLEEMLLAWRGHRERPTEIRAASDLPVPKPPQGVGVQGRGRGRGRYSTPAGTSHMADLHQ